MTTEVFEDFSLISEVGSSERGSSFWVFGVVCLLCFEVLLFLSPDNAQRFLPEIKADMHGDGTPLKTSR